MKSFKQAPLLIVLAVLAARGWCNDPSPPLEDFFRDYTFDEIKVSPDGTKVAALSKWKDHLNLYVIDLKTKRPTQLTGLTIMDVTEVRWIGNDRLIFTGQDDGYSTGGLFAIDADGKHIRTLADSIRQQGSRGSWVYRSTEFLDYYGKPVDLEGKSADEILVTCNERDELNPDVYRMNVRTGVKRMLARNPGDVRLWMPDGTGAVRVGFGEKGREQFLIYRDSANGDWREVKRWDFLGGTIRPLAFETANHLIYVSSNLGRDTAAICLLDPATGKIVKELFAHDTYDAEQVILSRADGSLLGFFCNAEKPEVVWTDGRMKNLQALVDQELPETRNFFPSRSLDNTWIVISAATDRDPGTFYLLNTRELTMEKLVSRADWLKPSRMAEMKPISYQARDGSTVHGYLTVPPAKEPRHLPLIVNPHGGPWYRDSWGFNPEVQFLASRGYAVLQVNFRGSTGYGRKWLEAGYGQWGLAMQDDITDGVRWAIDQGVADPKRIAIYGASYGGYATMAGLAFTPELYRCGINYVGVTDIELLLRTIPDAWESIRAQLEVTTGDAKRDRERLRATSPLLNADKIRAPVFFAYGELDDRVDLKHATKLATQLRKHGVPVEWMIRSDEGHGYRRWKNKIRLYQAMEKFLATNLTAGGKPPVTTGTPEVLEMPAVEKR
ncbi:MAG: S9 family peptidase [Opitutaceae bacterium]